MELKTAVEDYRAKKAAQDANDAAIIDMQTRFDNFSTGLEALQTKAIAASDAYDQAKAGFIDGSIDEIGLEAARIAFISAQTALTDATEVSQKFASRLAELQNTAEARQAELDAAGQTARSLIKAEVKAKLITASKLALQQYIVCLRKTGEDHTADTLESVFYRQANLFPMPSEADWQQVSDNMDNQYGLKD